MKEVYLKGNRKSFADLPLMAERKEMIFLKTGYSERLIPAFEMLEWRLKSILRVEIFEAVKQIERQSKKIKVEI